MAAIDKIYVNSYKQYLEFKNWCEQQPFFTDKYGKKCTLMNFLWEVDESFEGGPIMNTPYYVDAILIRTCPLDFIQEELMLNYGHWSQKRIKEFYNDVINWKENEECPYWAKPEDFITLDDGTMTIKGLEESDYSKIKKGYLYYSPSVNNIYTAGKHFKCIKHPKIKYNTPFNCKFYIISVTLPEEIGGYMWYHKEYNSWDFSEDFVFSGWSSSTAFVKTIRALKRNIIKWKLPIGTIVTATGRYIEDSYKFIVNK